MTTRKFSVPTYADLAKAGATIKRDIAPAVCERLALQVEELETVSTELNFFLDEQGRTKVVGRAAATVKIMCQLCMLPVALEMHAEVDAALAAAEGEADEWREINGLEGIIVTSGPELNELELVEDELLLSLPTRICIDLACEQRPVMYYPEVAAEDAGKSGMQRPFAALEKLRGGYDSTDEPVF